jgi:tRNA pseudouridine38-40 synthase
MRKFLLTISYDGTNYYGWQKQRDRNTVEGEVEKACIEAFGADCELLGTSRTDRGVHALGQRATIKCDTTVPLKRITYLMNSKLPEDIVVVAATEVPLDFHPRYSTSRKTYEYKIVNADYMIPQLRNFAEFIYKPLDLVKMQKAAQYFVGEHDFKAFCCSDISVKTTVRTITDITLTKTDSIIVIRVSGNGFLYNMVRILAGTLVYVGLGKIEPEDIPSIIQSLDRTKAGKTLSPQGLTLIAIDYEEKYEQK